jgi:DNA topoisomerase-1
METALPSGNDRGIQLSKGVQEFVKSTGKVCEKCGKPMVHRVKKPGKGGYDFWGCSGWPECK